WGEAEPFVHRRIRKDGRAANESGAAVIVESVEVHDAVAVLRGVDRSAELVGTPATRAGDGETQGRVARRQPIEGADKAGVPLAGFDRAHRHDVAIAAGETVSVSGSSRGHR